MENWGWEKKGMEQWILSQNKEIHYHPWWAGGGQILLHKED